MRDVLFLGQKSIPATEEDLQVGRDLQDTLAANREACVGMAANMIGVKKRIIIVNAGFRDIIMFNPLNKESALQIAELEIGNLTERMQANGYSLLISDRAKEFVVEKGFNAQYGARSLKRAIQQHIEDALCDYMMEHTDAKHFKADIKDNKVFVSEVATNEL